MLFFFALPFAFFGSASFAFGGSAFAAGVSKKQIVAELNAVGLRNRNGNLFSNTALQTAFQNKKYIGILGWNGIAVENTCPALIDEETFNKVQERIMINKKLAGKRKAKIEYLLTGKIFCGYCGATMGAISSLGAIISSNPLPSFHPQDLLVGLIGAACIRAAVYIKAKNAKKYRHGVEYGSARWGNAQDI